MEFGMYKPFEKKKKSKNKNENINMTVLVGVLIKTALWSYKLYEYLLI